MIDRRIRRARARHRRRPPLRLQQLRQSTRPASARKANPSWKSIPKTPNSRGISTGDPLLIENERGWCLLQADVTEDVIPGFTVSPKGYWAQNSLAGRNVNWLTSDGLADLGNQAVFHSNLVRVRKLSPEEYEARLTENGMEPALATA